MIVTPYHYISKYKIWGIFFGVFLGLFNFFLKPFIAIFDCIIIILSGLYCQITYQVESIQYRSRPPRVFNFSGVLEDYNFQISQAIDLIHTHRIHTYKHEQILYYMMSSCKK